MRTTPCGLGVCSHAPTPVPGLGSAPPSPGTSPIKGHGAALSSKPPLLTGEGCTHNGGGQGPQKLCVCVCVCRSSCAPSSRGPLSGQPAHFTEETEVCSQGKGAGSVGPEPLGHRAPRLSPSWVLTCLGCSTAVISSIKSPFSWRHVWGYQASGTSSVLSLGTAPLPATHGFPLHMASRPVEHPELPRA